MTRHEHGQLQDAIFELHEGYAFRAIRILEAMALEAQKGFDAEDRYWSSVEAESVPVNAEAA
jgi:hypothetical protein